MSAALRIKRAGNRHELTLNRPDQGNRLSDDLVAALDAALQDATAAGVAMVVLRAEGRNFCTGFDLSDLEVTDDDRLLGRFIAIEQMLARLWAAPFVTCVYAQGQAIGAGADLFVCCRHRIAAPDARFSFPGPGFGLVLGTRRLGLRIGRERAGDLLRSGHALAAPKGVALGLVHDIMPPEDAAGWLAEQEARLMATGPAVTAALEAALRGPLQAGLDHDLAALVRSAAQPGLRDRILAYRERARAGRTLPTLSKEEETRNA